MKTILSYSLVLVSVIALSTCSVTEDNIVPPINAVDTIITIAERMAVFEACNKKSAELNNLESMEDRVSFLAWLGTQPAFYSVGFAGEDLYAVFQDGRVVFFVHKPLDKSDPTGGRVSSGGASKPPTTGTSQGRTEDLPKTKNVSLFNALGRYFDPNCRDAIKSIFDNAKAGYQVYPKDATIANLKAVSGDAVFYIHTHGGRGEIRDKKRGSLYVMALWTTERVTPELDTLYKEDLIQERLCYMKATNDTEVSEFHYAITSKFVSQYMRFGENCFIYLDACNGFNENIRDNGTFRDAMIEKSANQKATIVGWTHPTTAYRRTGQFVFDRLLGPYVGAAGVNISQEDPFQRPFDISEVMVDMRREGLGVSPDYGAELMYETTLEDEIILRPTIETIDIEEYTSTLIIKGLFPKDEGKVTVNDVAAVVTSWSPHGITCIIKETGDGSIGDVIVTSAEGINSNKVPLTEWIIKLNYSADDNGVKFAGVCDLRIRADVHPRRSQIGEEPTKPTYPDYSPRGGRIFNAKGSSAVYTVTGRKYDMCIKNGCNVQLTESPKPKVGKLDYTIAAAPNQKVPLFAMYNWGPEMKTIKLNFITINVTGIPDVREERIKCPDKPVAIIPLELPYGAWFGFPTQEIPDASITFEIADNYNIRPGSWSKTIDRPWSVCTTTGSFKQHVSWDVIQPKHAPTKETAARADDVTGN